MAFLKESCYGMAPLNSKESPLDFSCVFKDSEEARRLGTELVTATIKNNHGKETLLYLPETALYLPGRTSAEIMWRLLHENEGNRLLHNSVQFGNVFLREREFHYGRERGGYSLVNASLPSTEQIVHSLQALSEDLALRQKNTLYRTIDSLFELVLESNRKGRQVDPEAEFERLSAR